MQYGKRGEFESLIVWIRPIKLNIGQKVNSARITGKISLFLYRYLNI